MSNFIDDNIKIDFELPKDIQWLANICEEADRDNDYGKYMNYAEALTDTNAKEAYVQGHITKKQWKILENRYRQ